MALLHDLKGPSNRFIRIARARVVLEGQWLELLNYMFKFCSGTRKTLYHRANWTHQHCYRATTVLIPSFKYACGIFKVTLLIFNLLQRANGGQSQTFRVPFGNSAVFIMTEHILVDLGYRRYIPLDSPSDWEPALRNIVALSATVCELEIQQCYMTSWFKSIDLEAQGRTVYVKMTERMASLQGTDLREFCGMLSFWHLLLKTLPVC